MIEYKVVKCKDGKYRIKGIFLHFYSYWVTEKWWYSNSLVFNSDGESARYCQNKQLYPLKAGVYEE